MKKNRSADPMLAGTLFIVLTAVLWSFLGLISKYCMAHGMPPMHCAFWRCLFGFAAFFLHCAFTGLLSIPLLHILYLMLFGVWGIGVYYTCAQYTIMLVGAAMDIVLQYTAPVWVAIFARLLFRERLTPVKTVSMTIAAGGAVCVCLSGGSLPQAATTGAWVGIATGLVTGLCYASHYPFTRWWQTHYPTAVIFTWMLAGGTLALYVVTRYSLPLRVDFPMNVWLACAATGMLCTYLAFVCYGAALRRISLVQAVITSELEPVLSMLWVWLFFGECFSPIGWAGSALIILSVLILGLAGRQK
ncbi:MAG: EamA family transporter [Desulfovibrio sp.]|nr:EamA family transporter [Desulfovibrio sp.]